MSDLNSISIRSFVLGANHGQYLQAAGLARAVGEAASNAQVTHARYHNHLTSELKVQAKGFLIPKYLAMRLHWERKIAFSNADVGSDVTIYGSDQIWSFSNNSFPPDKYYFGVGDTSRKIAYAPAMGAVDRDFTFPSWAAESLVSFEALAVRDTATADAVERTLGKRPEIVVDPAFFLVNPGAAVPKRENRLAVYCHSARLTLPKLRTAGTNLIGGWPVDMYGYAPSREAWRRLSMQLTMPEQVVAGIARSRLLYTSTFHGVVMALMTGTPFVARSSQSLMDRLSSPIGRETFGSFRLLEPDEFDNLARVDVERLLDDSDIDTTKISKLVAASRSWLVDALAKVDATRKL